MFETESTRRIRVLVRVALGWALIIVLRLVYLQICQHQDFVRIAHQQQQKELEIKGPRGTIFDRTGQPLAKSLPVDSICVNPLRIPDIQVAAEILAKTLDLNATELYAGIKSAADRNRGFLWIT